MTNTDDQKLIQHIIDVAESSQIIPASQVKEWLVHPSLDVQGSSRDSFPSTQAGSLQSFPWKKSFALSRIITDNV
jgi:hypothetical protein